MKIGPNSTDGIRIDGKTVGPERAQAVRTDPTSAPVPAPQGSDRVSLSGASPVLAGPAAAPPFDDKKVEEVRRAIAEGRFPVDAKRIANELISEAREFLGIGAQAPR
jgi:negative regulator of flagellin synthesis FlgM